MRKAEAVATFEEAKAKALDSSTWALKVRIWRVRHRLQKRPCEPDKVRIVALQDVLKHRDLRARSRHGGLA